MQLGERALAIEARADLGDEPVAQLEDRDAGLGDGNAAAPRAPALVPEDGDTMLAGLHVALELQLVVVPLLHPLRHRLARALGPVPQPSVRSHGRVEADFRVQ